MSPILSRLARLVLAAALVLAALPAAQAAAACPDEPSFPAFERFADTAQYALAPGGSFEGSLAWAATGSPTLVARNNPFALSGPGATSVRVRGRDTITSPPICVDALRPTLRFVTRALDRESHLVLDVLWYEHGALRQVAVTEEHSAAGWPAWAPSKIVPLGRALPTDAGEVHEVRLRFSLRNAVGEWLVDDVFVDPYRR